MVGEVVNADPEMCDCTWDENVVMLMFVLLYTTCAMFVQSSGGGFWSLDYCYRI